MRKVLLLVISASLLLTAIPALAQAEAPNPDSPAATAESTPDMAISEDMALVLSNPLNVSASDSVAFVRFAHTAVDGAHVDLYVQGLGDQSLAENLALGDATGFILLPAGNYNVLARSAGSGAGGEVITTTGWNFQPDTSWLVAFAGLASNSTLQIEPVNLLRGDIADDRARVRVVNFLSGGPALSVSSSEGNDFGQGLGWLGVFDADMTPGSANLTVSTEDGTALLTDAIVDLPNGTLTTLLLVGSADGSQPLQFITFSAPAYASRVQFINNGDAPIQLFMRPGDVELVGSLAPGAASDWVSVSSGAVTFVAYAPGTGPTGQELGAWIGTVQPARDLAITYMADYSADEGDPNFTPEMTPDQEAAG